MRLISFFWLHIALKFMFIAKHSKVFNKSNFRGIQINDDDDDCYIYSFYRTSSHVNKTKENNSTY